ncbi:hypothetical protein DMC01_12930, partial [Campylobacter troglodytis]
MKFTKLGFDEYNKIRKLLLIGSEDFKEQVYRDSSKKTADKNGVYSGYMTIGIGINIEFGARFWEYLVLYYLFGLTKLANEIEFKSFDTVAKLKKQILKENDKKQEYNELIENIHKFFGKTKNEKDELITIEVKKLNEEELRTHLDDNIKQGIQEYISTTKKLGKEEQAKRLNETELKISKNAKGEAEYIKFKLGKEEAREVFDLMAINYEARALEHFNKHIFVNTKLTNPFNKIKEKDTKNKKYYKEFIPFMSATYQAPFVLAKKDNALLLKKAFEFKSRFLLWAILRYKLGSN